MQDLVVHKMLVIWCGGFYVCGEDEDDEYSALSLRGAPAPARQPGGCHLNLCGALEHFPNRGGGAFEAGASRWQLLAA